MDRSMVKHEQLNLEVLAHPTVRAQQERGESSFLTASLQLKVDVPVHVNLNSGDPLVVTIAGEDGELLARTFAEVRTATPTPIEEKDLGVIGMERVHKARQTDG